MLSIFVPTPGLRVTVRIAPRSGIVGTYYPNDQRVLIDYEGNLYGASNIKTYADRLRHAAGRHTERYPTVARRFVTTIDVIQIGTFDYGTGEIEIMNPVLLAEWLEVPLVDPAELRYSS